MAYTDAEIIGIIIGCLIGIPLFIFLVLYLFRLWMRGPTRGSDNPKKLDGKLVVITGKKSMRAFVDLHYRPAKCQCYIIMVTTFVNEQ